MGTAGYSTQLSYVYFSDVSYRAQFLSISMHPLVFVIIVVASIVDVNGRCRVVLIIVVLPRFGASEEGEPPSTVSHCRTAT
jgi:hypothetical protein